MRSSSVSRHCSPPPCRREVKKTGIDAKVIIGGAPVTQSYADEIGAAGYAPDAASAVDKAKELLGVA